MAGRFVRASKYRHVFGRPTRKEQCYDNLHISRNAWDSNLVKANPQYLSVNWDASGGGAFAVIPLEEKGRLPEPLPLFRGHTAVVLDTDWNPFNDSIIASGSDDGKAFIWRVPEGFTLHSEDPDDIKDVSPVAKLSGHSRKVGHVLFNPSASNVLATSSGDFTIKIWDIEAGSPRLTLKHADIVQALSWSANGALLVTTSRDKKIRIWDARQEKPVHIGAGHAGAKSSRVVWMGEHDRFATTGFSKMSDRQLGLWDIRSPDEPVGGFDMLDSISGVCMPFWDDGTQCLFLAGKGDGNIRYFEYEHDKFEFLSEYKSADPQRGIAFIPKRGVNIHENEVMRAYKTVNDSYIEPISFIVPRRSEVFQSDIYPPAVGSKPGMSQEEYFSGKDAMPPKIDLESVYEGGAPVEVASDYKPPAPLAAKAPEPKQPEPVVEQQPSVSAISREPPPSMKEQSASISNMASKFADKDDVENDDDASSFEEVAKPVERNSAAPAQPPAEEETKEATPTATESAQRPTSSEPATGMWKSQASEPTNTTSPAQSSNPASDALGSHLAEIKSLLQQQRVTMAAQSDMILQLTTEVDQLKRNQGSSDSKDARIQALEKELAGLKS